MVDLRETLKAAEADGIVDRSERNALTMAMKQLHFGARSFTRLIEMAYEVLGSARAGPFAAWLKLNRVPRKRLDAIELIETVSRFVADDPPPFVPTFRMESTLVWHRFLVEAAHPTLRAMTNATCWRSCGLCRTGGAKPLGLRWEGERLLRQLTSRTLTLWASSRMHSAGRAVCGDAPIWTHGSLQMRSMKPGFQACSATKHNSNSAARASVADLASAMAAHLRLTGEFARLLVRAAPSAR